MKVRTKVILFIIILLISGCVVGVSTLNADLSMFSMDILEIEQVSENTMELQAPVTPRDTVKEKPKPRFPVAKTTVEEYKDLTKERPIDLRTPENLKTEFEYDPKTNTYLMRTKIGDSEVSTPFSMTQEQYLEYTMDKSIKDYFRARNAEEVVNQDKPQTFSPFDMKFSLGPAEKIFGPGGVQLQANGSIDLKMALTHTYTGDPTASELTRSRFAFDFDEQIQANIKAKVGDKLNFDMNYNTETTFDFDSKKLKLAYQGKEDEVLKLLEAGNVSMTTSNSLINGGSALFGIKAEMQFGKLKVGAIFSQQESESKTISSKKGVQTTPFEITADAYEENQHFFLAHYFRDNYDKAMETLPYIKSPISIDRIEVWVTNTRANYEEARNLVVFSDLAEHDTSNIYNDDFVQPVSGPDIPYNGANTLYDKIKKDYPETRNISQVNQVLASTSLKGGIDYEKIENARKLNETEYTCNRQLGYISLKSRLQPDEVLAVAFEYTYKGVVYQVGEFSKDNSQNPGQTIYLKLLKGTAMSPSSPFWNLMMKNVYSLNTYSLQPDKFKLDVLYLNDTTGVYLNYIPEGKIANQLLIRVMNLDRLDAKNNPYPDGFFDYVENYTVLSQTGKIIFPVVEPFGSHLFDEFDNPEIAKKYVYQELYDSTLTVARQSAEKNKFILRGEYRGSGSSGGDIDLGTYNVAKGSVRVTSNGQVLKEGVDYTVDYIGGKVTLSQHIADSGAPVSVSLEGQSMYGMQRKTLTGLNLEYAFSPDFNIGATVMNLREMPITMKVNMGDESINNTIYGFNTNFKTESQWLTNMLDKLPLLELTAPSQINFSAEFAQLIPGHYKSEYGGDHSYIDDFERSKVTYDLRSPYSWFLASTPNDDAKDGTPPHFPEATKSNDIEYGINRSLLAWYSIDPLFTRQRNSLTPTHIKADVEQLSSHYVREVSEKELFPNKELSYTESAMLPIFNLAYYPKERGPYNLDAENVDRNTGYLTNPEKRWGGIMRKMEKSQTDFEAANIEYIEFWLMDPFIYDHTNKGGDLYFNLGEISEDILKDEKKFFENGLPVNGDTSAVTQTVWGKVPTRQSTVYAFDADPTKRKLQDVGLNGLSSAEETVFPTYVEYLRQLEDQLNPDLWQQMKEDRFSPFNDPSGDLYHHYRGSDYDREERSILYRYKRYNGTEGNSAASEDASEDYNTSSKVTPDVEDINQDNTLNEYEKYFQYKVELTPDQLEVGTGKYVTDKRTALVKLRNGEETNVDWYQFKIPIKDFTKKIGDIRDFKTIRFMRMYLTNFEDSVILRFGTFELVRGGWRTYTQSLAQPGVQPVQTGVIDMSTVNIEENSDRKPVNYVLPPGVNRIFDPGEPQLRQENEQAMSLKVKNLERGDAKAVYQTAGLDTRQYKRLQMFVHAEKFIDDNTDLQNNELSVFLRLGSDYKNNYYEYEIPLVLTPAGTYSSYNTADQKAVWPEENMFDFPLELLTNLKLNRNKEKRKTASTVNYYTPYTENDPQKPKNQVTVVGNPSLSNIKVIMIGVRNNGAAPKSGEVWVNELRVTEFNEDGGWAANANLNVALSDLGSVNLAGRTISAGFGSLEQGIMERSLDDFYQYNISANVELGKIFPEKAKVSMPVYYTYSEQVSSPKYNPLDQDVLLKEALDAAGSKQERDSINNFSQDVMTTKSINFNNVKVGIKSKNPMPWDPDNFNLSYSYAENKKRDPSIEYETNTDTRLGLGYAYSPYVKPFAPFKNMENKTGSTKFLREFDLNYLPNSLTFNTELTRNYYELQLKDLNNLGGEYVIKPSYREDFYWNRSFGLQWNLTKNLNMSLQTGTQARIDAAHRQVNKEMNRDDYMVWKDSVWQSIMDFGTPLSYAQTFNATYNVPFRSIPVLDFITASLTYNAKYNWDKGAELEGNIDLGNIIANERTFSINNVSFNLLNLYNKSDFLKKVNQKFVMKRPASANTPASQKSGGPVKKEPRKYETEVSLNLDSATMVSHRLNNKRIRVTARGADGKLYALSYKVMDNNAIKISNKDSVKLKVIVTQMPPLDEERWYKVAQVAARGAMMVRSAGFSYSVRQGLNLPNFRPDVGDAFGQGRTNMGAAPGLDFAFGFTDESYIDRALDRNWLITENEDNITPAMFNSNETFTFKATLEPFVGFKIDLNAKRSVTDRQEIYVYNNYGGVNKKLSGMFEMTTVAIGTSLENSTAENGYYSKAFETFLDNRNIIKSRLEKTYNQSKYPDAGFVGRSETVNPGDPFNPANGDLTLNSMDVLLPAFISAYLNKNPNTTSLSPFPSLKSILPNWKITYDGLMQLDFINRYFKNFTLMHDYQCRYLIGNYASYQSWVQADNVDNGFGFIQDVLTNNPTPSSPYDISAASINESFAPLIGLNATFKSNMSMKLEMKNTRNVNLNVSSYQIVESTTNSFVVGVGYKLTEFNKVLKMKATGGSGFSNDLTLSADFSYQKMQSLIRKIQDAFSQGTSGNSNTTIKITADYNLSRMISVQAFFDRMMSQPLVSATAYPNSKSSFGINIKVKLSR